MRWAKATALLLIALAGPARAQPVSADILIQYAECLGAGDQYARDAAVYGYDSTDQDARADLHMSQLMAQDASPGAPRLLRARREGRVTYAALTQALQGQTEGPAWDTLVAFSAQCDAARAILERDGVITER